MQPLDPLSEGLLRCRVPHPEKSQRTFKLQLPSVHCHGQTNARKHPGQAQRADFRALPSHDVCCFFRCFPRSLPIRKGRRSTLSATPPLHFGLEPLSSLSSAPSSPAEPPERKTRANLEEDRLLIPGEAADPPKCSQKPRSGPESGCCCRPASHRDSQARWLAQAVRPTEPLCDVPGHKH